MGGLLFVIINQKKVFLTHIYRNKLFRPLNLDLLNSMILLPLMNFESRFSLELMYISFIVNIRSSLTHLHSFQLLVLLPYLIRNNFFRFYQNNKSSESKVKFRQSSNHCKRVLEAAKLHIC